VRAVKSNKSRSTKHCNRRARFYSATTQRRCSLIALFVSDAFSNIDQFKFAVRGTLATMLAYVIYQAVEWPGLSTAVVTCILTALSTFGSSTQKQFLRLGGAIIGGFIFGMGAQIFVLP